jgi:hypothetical protein
VKVLYKVSTSSILSLLCTLAFAWCLGMVAGCIEERDGVGSPTTDTVVAADISGSMDADPSMDVAAPGDINVSPPDVSLEPQELAGICVYDKDCIDGWCNGAYAGGYCSLECGADADCPEGGKCFPDPLSGKKMCWKSCTFNGDCRSDQFCADGVDICTPDCQFDTCKVGYKCDALSGQCTPVASIDCEPVDEVCDGQDNDCDDIIDEGCGTAPTATDQVLVEDLGLIEAGGGGLSPTIPVKISSAAKSFMIIITSADGSDDLVSLWTLQSPSGEELVVGSNPYESPIRISPQLGHFATLVPNTPEVAIESGTYKFSIYKEGEAGKFWVSIVQVIRPELKISKLNVNFWFTGLGSLWADKAKGNNKFKSLVSYFVGLLAQHGIQAGTFEYFDVDPAVASKFAIIDTADAFEVDEHSQLLSLSKSLPKSNTGVNFFFVKGFTGWGLLGKAGGIPGPPVHGTYGSGVAVSLADYFEGGQDGKKLTAHAMVHELGHQIGLFHTSEQTGSMFDPLSDTPKCANDFNGDGMVDFGECIGKGNTNVMFWMAHFDNVLTEDQKFVIHRNPSLYE